MPEHKSAKALASHLFFRKTIINKLPIQSTFIKIIFLGCCMDCGSWVNYLCWTEHNANGKM